MSGAFILYASLVIGGLFATYASIAVAAWLGAEWEERQWRKKHPTDRGKWNVE
jgi:preprotein translocase subunit SecF